MVDSVGFTGTQKGMTKEQKHRIEVILITLRPKHVHHGDCIGADAEFHAICDKLKHRPIIHIHPPSNPKKRAFCKGDVMYTEKPYKKRNHDIVAMSDKLIATPKEDYEIMIGSGTWQTIRMGNKANIEVYIVVPNGDVVF